MATLQELKDAYLATWGYVPPRIDNWAGAVTEADIQNVLSMGSGESAGDTTTAPSSSTSSATPAPSTAPLTGGGSPSTWSYTPPDTSPPSYMPPTVPEFTANPADTASLYLPPWLRDTILEQTWIDRWAETGDGNLALQAVREHAQYDEVFPGNRRTDGTIRYDEATYFGLIESYEDQLLSINLNPDLFRDKFADMIAGLVSPTEFATRVNSLYDRILTATPDIREYYANEFGMDMSTEAIIASFMDPDIGQAIIERRISVSEVGGEAAARNFTVGRDLAEQIVNYGVDTAQEAQSFFGQAEMVTPVMNVLAARHLDPEDGFDIYDFTNAQLFGDPDERRRMRRLLAQERTTFGSDRRLTISQGPAGTLTGLESR